MLLIYSDESKTYRLLDVDRGHIKLSRSVVIPESNIRVRKKEKTKKCANEVSDFEDTEETVNDTQEVQINFMTAVQAINRAKKNLI